MKKIGNNGFTLLEMMSVLILLIIILLVAVPNITNTIKKDKVNQMEKYEETLCNAARSYIEIEDSELEEISGALLISENYIADNLINPESKDNASKDSVLITIDSNGDVDCHLKE